MRRATTLVISIAVAGLTYAALDDITTGNEASQLWEWISVAAGSAWFGALAISRMWRDRRTQ